MDKLPKTEAPLSDSSVVETGIGCKETEDEEHAGSDQSTDSLKRESTVKAEESVLEESEESDLEGSEMFGELGVMSCVLLEGLRMLQEIQRPPPVITGRANGALWGSWWNMLSISLEGEDLLPPEILPLEDRKKWCELFEAELRLVIRGLELVQKHARIQQERIQFCIKIQKRQESSKQE